MQEPTQESTQTALSFCLLIVVMFVTLYLKMEAARNLEALPTRGTLESFANVP